MRPKPQVALACLFAAASLPAQVFVTNTSNLIAYYNFESTGNAGIANQVAGGSLLDGVYMDTNILGSGAGFSGSAAFEGGNGDGGVNLTSDRSTLLVGNALNLVKQSTTNTGSTGVGAFWVKELSSNTTTAANGTSVTLGPSFTISTWHYMAKDPDNTTTDTRQYIFESRYNWNTTSGDNWDVSFGTSGNNTSFTSYNTTATTISDTILPAGQWHNVVHSFSSAGGNTTLTLYVNGVQVGTVSRATADMAFESVVFGEHRAGGRTLDGMMDEVTAWKSALTAHDAYITYNLGLAGVATNASIALRTKSNNTTTLNQSGSWGGTAPAAGDLLLVDSTYAQAGSVDLGGNVTVRGLRVTTGSSLVDVTASAGTLSVGALGIDMFAAARDLRIASLTAAADQRWQVAAARTLTVSSLAGSAAVEKIGAGALVLGGGGTFTGTLTLSAGSTSFATGTTSRALGGLAGSANLALQDGAATPAAVTLTVGGNHASTTYSGVLSGPGSLTKSGTGTLTLTGANTYAGSTLVTAGTLAITQATALPGFDTAGRYSIGSGAVLSVSNTVTDGNVTSLLATGNFASGSFLGLDTSAGNRTYAAAGLGGVAGLAKLGSNTLTLSSAASTAGGARVLAGTLDLGGLTHAFAGGLSILGGTLSNGTLDLGSAVDAQSGTVSAVLQGAVALTKSGAGTLTLSGANTFAGGTTLSAGNLALGSNTALGTGALTLASGTLQTNGSNRVVANALAFQASGNANLGGAVGGDLILTGAATGTGTATVNSSSSRSVWFQGDWSGFTGTVDFTSVTGGTNLRLGGTPGTTTVDSGTNASDFSQAKFVLSGSGTDRQLLWNGLAGHTVQIGELSGTGGRIGVASSSGCAANWQVGALGTSTTFGGIIEGTGNALTKVGAGILTLSGTNTHTGGTTVNAGTLNITGTTGGAVAVNSGATLAGTGTLSGAVTVNSGGVLSLVNGAASTFTLGSLSLNSASLTLELGDFITLGGGALSLAGETTLTLAGTITAGTYQLMGFGSRSGTGSLNLVTPGRFSATPTLGASGYSVILTAPNLAWNGGTGTWDGISENWLLNAGSTNFLEREDVTIGGSADQTVTVTSGIIPGDVTLNPSAGTTTLAGAGFGGIGSVTKSGAGTAVLAAPVTTTGGIAVNEGTLRLAAGGSLLDSAALSIATGATFDLDGRSQTLGSLAGTGSVALGSGALTVSSSGNSSFAGELSGSGSLAKSGAGTLTLTGANAHTGATSVSAGTVNLSNASALGSSTLTLSGGSVAFDASVAGNAFAVGGLAGSSNLALANNAGTPAAVALTVGANNASTTYSGSLSGAGSLAKSGTGSLTLSGANGHTGGTTVNAGALLIGHASALGNGGTLTLNGGTLASSSSTARTVSQSVSVGGDIALGQASGGTGALEFTGAVDLGAGTRTVTTVSNVILRGNLSNGSLVKAGDGTLVIGGTPSLDALTVTAGRTLVTSSAGLGNAVVTLAGGELRLQGAGDFAGGLVLSGGAASNRLSLGLEVDYLVVGGGGGGAGRDSSGGGGGGGVLSNLLLAGGSPVLLTPGTLTVAVGAGGAGAIGPDGSGVGTGALGGSSTFGQLVALGGGGGGGYGIAGTSGATGGGSGRASAVSSPGAVGQGFAGGQGTGGGSSVVDTGGGGGGAGGAGQGGVSGVKGGDGGIGLAVDITGLVTYYGGGGGGSPHRSSALSGGAGGLGGGGAAATSSSVGPSSGVANTGGGGGASRSDVTGRNSGGDGGSGIVIIRYLGDAVATGGTITAGTGAATGYTFHTFTLVGEAQFSFVGDRRVAGVISGDGGFTYATPGHRLFLDATNTYTGGTVIGGGILVANAAGSLGSGAVSVTSGGILQAAVSGALGSTAVTLGSGSRLDVQSIGALGSAAVTAGSGSIVGFRTDGLTLAQMSTEASAVTWQTGSQLALDTTGGDFTLDQEFQSDAALAKTGSNNLVFAVADSVRTGNLTLVEGGIRLGASGALGSGSLTLGAGTSLATDGVASRVAANALVLQGNLTLGSAGEAQPDLVLSGEVDLGGATRTLDVLSATTLSSAIANGGLIKAGAGDLTLSGTSTFSGGLTLLSGALRLGSDNALGTGPLVLSGGVISSDSSAARAGTTTATYGGNLTFGDSVANGALTFSGAVDLGGAARTLTVLSDTTLSGVVSNGGLVKTGAGTLTLSGATTFTGTFTVSEGTLKVTGSNSNGSATIRVETGGTLDLAGGQGLFRTGAFQGGQGTTHVFVDAGTLVVDRFNYGDGSNLNQLRNNSYAIRMSNGGRIRHTASEEFLRGVIIGTGGAVFETDAGVTVTKLAGSNGSQNLIGFSANSSLTFAGAGTYVMQDALGTSNYSGATSTGFSLAKQDAGTLRLTGANAYTGGTTVTGGLLEFASGSLGSTGAISVNGGSLRWLSGNTQDISPRLSLGAAGATLDVAAGTVNLATGIAAAGNLTKAGAGRLDLAASATVAGLLSVDAGTLSVASVGALGSGAVTLGSGAVLRLALGLTDNTLLSNSFVGGADTILDIDHGNELLALGFGGLQDFAGRLRLTSGLVDLTGYNGGIIFAGGSIAGDLSEVTVPVEVGAGAILNAANGLPAQVVLGAGGTLDFFGASGDALNRVILFTGGTLANAEQFTGTLRIQGSVSLGNALLGGSNLATVEVQAGSTATIEAGFDGAIRFMGGQIEGLANYLGTMTVDGSLGPVQISLGTAASQLSLGASFNLTSGGRLVGTGIIRDLTVASGGVLAPGNSPGVIEAGNLSLLAGGGAEFEFLATDPAGVSLVAGEDFDLVRAFDLDLSALSSSQRFQLDLISLSGLTTGGTIAGWDSELEQSWDIYEYLSLTLSGQQEQFRGGNLTSLFLIDSSAFLDENGLSIAANRFSITDTGASIRLTYSPIPEPSTYGLAFGLLALASVAVRRRARRHSGTAARN